MGVADEGDRAGHGVEDLLDAGAHMSGAAVAVGGAVRGVGGADQGGQTGAFDVVEPEGACLLLGTAATVLTARTALRRMRRPHWSE